MGVRPVPLHQGQADPISQKLDCALTFDVVKEQYHLTCGHRLDSGLENCVGECTLLSLLQCDGKGGDTLLWP